MGEITIQKLKAITGQFDPDMIYKVSLANAGITSIPDSLNQCPNLTVLDLSFNSLTSVENLSSFKYLKTLILFSNKIEKLDGFKNIPSLEQLYLQKNKVKNLSELSHLSELSNLKVLSLQSLDGEDRNPVCQNTPPTVYKDTILQSLPHLQILDEARTSDTSIEFYSAVRDNFDIEPEMLVLDRYSNWSKEIHWKDIPIHVKVQLNTSDFKEKLVSCNDALMQADKALQKAKDVLSNQQEHGTVQSGRSTT